MFLFISLVFALQSQTLWWRMKGCEPAAACNTQMYKEPDQSLYVCDLQFVLTPTCLCEGSAQAAGVNTRHRCSHSSKWRLLHTLWPLPLHPPTASTTRSVCSALVSCVNVSMLWYLHSGPTASGRRTLAQQSCLARGSFIYAPCSQTGTGLHFTHSTLVICDSPG